ncbi:MAG TPA: Uma2 family endonuclease [Planktothrix sp.]|jgi:Uma2 family endonuclease
MAEKLKFLTPEEYLLAEETSPVRHEYVNGLLFAMTGTSQKHNLISLNIYSALRAHLRGSSCKAFVEAVKARVHAANSFYYPDVMVACDTEDGESVYSDQPTLLVEVLSRSTSTIDKREKAAAYKQIPSLKHYMIVHQSKRRVELHTRAEAGLWEIYEFVGHATLELGGLPNGQLSLSLDSIYEDINQETSGTRTVNEQVDDRYETGADVDW